VLDERAADKRADDCRDREGCGDVPLVPRALARRDEVAHGRHRERHQAAGPGPLHGAADDQPRHVLGRAGDRRRSQEQQQ